MNPHRSLAALAARLASASALALCAVATAQAQAQTYPAKPIRIVVPFAAGGGTSNAARLLGEALTRKWGQPIIIDNKPGGNTVIGAQLVARAPADGYTLLFVNSSFAINPSLQKLPYDSLADFTPVGTVLVNPFVLLVHPKVSARNLGDFTAMLRARPEDWNLPTVGATGVGRVASEMFSQAVGVKLQNIPYKGSSELATNLVAGELRFAIEIPGVYLQHVRANRLHALAVSGRTRLDSLPDVPTFAEAGMPQFDVQSWYGLLAPAGTPAPVIAKWSEGLREVLQSEEMRRYLTSIDAQAMVGTPAEFGALIRSEMQNFARVIKERRLDLE